MKLEDVDQLVRFKSEFYTAHAQLKAVKGAQPKFIACNNARIDNWKVLAAAQQAMIPIIQTLLDEAKTRLMLLGVDQFPE